MEKTDEMLSAEHRLYVLDEFKQAYENNLRDYIEIKIRRLRDLDRYVILGITGVITLLTINAAIVIHYEIQWLYASVIISICNLGLINYGRLKIEDFRYQEASDIGHHFRPDSIALHSVSVGLVKGDKATTILSGLKEHKSKPLPNGIWPKTDIFGTGLFILSLISALFGIAGVQISIRLL